MKNEDGVKWDGKVDFLILKDGEVIRKYQEHNSISNYAKTYIAQIITNSLNQYVFPSQMELGTGTGNPSGSDTDLWSPSVGTLKLCSGVQVYLTYFAQFITTWATTDPIVGTWTEIGLKDINGNLWAHAAITSNLTVNPGEMLVAQWAVQIIGS